MPGNTTPARKKINAHALADKVRSGASFHGLRAELDLSESGMHRVFEKLVTAGFIREDEIPPVKSASLRDSRILPTVKCPKCGQPQLASDEFCRGCGTALDEKDGVVSNGENPHQERGRTAFDVALTKPIVNTPEKLSSGMDGDLVRRIVRPIAILFAIIFAGSLVFKLTGYESGSSPVGSAVYGPTIRDINRVQNHIVSGLTLETLTAERIKMVNSLSDLQVRMAQSKKSNPEALRLLQESITKLRHAQVAWSDFASVGVGDDERKAHEQALGQILDEFVELSNQAVALMKQ